VLVVGAGPVGLCLACHLRLAGVRVRVIDQKSGPSVHSKAIGLQHRVSEILARLGVVDRFIARGGSPTVVRIHEGSRTLVTLRFHAPPKVSGQGAFQPRPILLPQSETEQLLIERLSELGGTVEWRSELLDYAPGTEAVASSVRGPDGTVQTIAARWLVGCDGAHSVVRRGTELRFEGKTYPLSFLLVDLRLETRLDHDENHVWVSRQGSLALLPLPAPGSWRIFIDITDTNTDPAEDPAALLARVARQRAPGLDLRPLGAPLWVSDFRINCRMVDPMQSGRVFLAGDAAHIHSPTGGQGITTGMQDAANLAWKLARVIGGAPADLLNTYSEERVPHAREVLAETDRTTRLLLAPPPALRLVRDLVLLPLLNSRRLQTRMFGKFAQLHVHYRASSLSQERVRGGWRSHYLRAGDRAPDVSFLVERTGATTLFDLLSDLDPVVLASGPLAGALLAPLRKLGIAAYEVLPRNAVVRDSRLVDHHGDFANFFGRAPDGLWLVRPDGHLGLVQRPIDVPQLAGYLRRICDFGSVEEFLSELAGARRR
jgi:2-polyprenyl-6-methoxyphenol hydroxylase-like FAD-dependent oxidoreductase